MLENIFAVISGQGARQTGGKFMIVFERQEDSPGERKKLRYFLLTKGWALDKSSAINY
jgi:hypothetical protein